MEKLALCLLLGVFLVPPQKKPPMAQWRRAQEIWATPCGYAFHLSAVEKEGSVVGFAPTYEDAQRQIQAIFQEDKKRGLVTVQ